MDARAAIDVCGSSVRRSRVGLILAFGETSRNKKTLCTKRFSSTLLIGFQRAFRQNQGPALSLSRPSKD